MLIYNNESGVCMILDIVYVVLWFVMAVYCFFSAHKVHNILYFAGIFFTFLFGWNLADLLLSVDMMSGTFAWIFRGIALCFLLGFLGYYIKLRMQSKNK